MSEQRKRQKNTKQNKYSRKMHLIIDILNTNIGGLQIDLSEGVVREREGI